MYVQIHDWKATAVALTVGMTQSLQMLNGGADYAAAGALEELAGSTTLYPEAGMSESHRKYKAASVELHAAATVCARWIRAGKVSAASSVLERTLEEHRVQPAANDPLFGTGRR